MKRSIFKARQKNKFPHDWDGAIKIQKELNQCRKQIKVYSIFCFTFFCAHDHGNIGIRGQYRPMNRMLKMI